MSDNNKYPHFPGSRRGAPETSREAAESIAPIASSIRARVHAAIAERGAAGATGDVVADALELSPVQVRARIAELHADKRIADSGRREMLGSGRRGVVWVLANYALAPDGPHTGQMSLLDAA